MKRIGRRKEGFTLIEVVVSIAILGMVSIPLCTSLMNGYEFALGTNSLLEDQLEAASIVEELMADGISVTKYTETTNDTTTTYIAVNDIVITTSDDTYSGYSAEINPDDGSYTITCYDSDQTYGYSASFVSPADYSNYSISNNIYPCTYTDSDGEAHDGICFLISDYSPSSTDFDAAACTFIMNFNWEFTEPDEDGDWDPDDDVLTLVFAPNFEYPVTSTTSIGASENVTISYSDGSTTNGSYDGKGTFTYKADSDTVTVTDNGDGTVTMNGSVYTVTVSSDNTNTQTWTYAGEAAEEAGPYWYDVAVSQGNVNINTSIRLADQEEDSGDEGISVTITYADETTESGTYYASLNTFISTDGSTYTVIENDGTVTLTDSDGNSTEYDVTVNDNGSQTWTAKSS